MQQRTIKTSEWAKEFVISGHTRIIRIHPEMTDWTNIFENFLTLSKVDLRIEWVMF